MKKHLSSLICTMTLAAVSANAQTPSTTVIEVSPGEPIIRSTTTTTEGPVNEVVPNQTTTVTEVLPGEPVTRATTTTPDGIVSEIVPNQTTTVTETGPVVPATTVTGTTITNSEMDHLDPVVIRRHLSVTPQPVTLTPEQRIALDRTVTIESRTEPVRRVYNVQRNVVIVEEQGESRELPYVTVPVPFVVDTAELLDAESRVALEQTAAVINEIAKTDPNALFDVEGHTSTEGTDEHNMTLSAERASRIHSELTQRYGVPASALTAHGYGENFATYPEGTEPERQADRRVLVVRTR